MEKDPVERVLCGKDGTPRSTSEQGSFAEV